MYLPLNMMRFQPAMLVYHRVYQFHFILDFLPEVSYQAVFLRLAMARYLVSPSFVRVCPWTRLSWPWRCCAFGLMWHSPPWSWRPGAWRIFPFQMGKTLWLLNGGDPNHLLIGMILQGCWGFFFGVTPWEQVGRGWFNEWWWYQVVRQQ